MGTFTRESLAGDATIIYLFTLRYAGKNWRFSMVPIEVNTADGDVLCFDGSLSEIDFEDGLELAGVPAPRSCSLAFLWPDADGVGVLVEQGHDLATATGELAAWIVGTTWEERLVLLDGIIPDPEYGEPTDEVTLTLEERRFDDLTTVRDPTEVITITTWPDRPDDVEGMAYPLVFGSPGRYVLSDGTQTKAGATPAYVCQTAGSKYLLIAGHPTKAGSDGDSVMVNNKEIPAWASFTAFHQADGNGRTCTLVDITAQATWTTEHTYAVSWEASAGIQRVDSTEPVAGAGDLVLLLLSRTDRVDWGRTRAARAALNRLQVGGYIDDDCGPLAWLTNNLLPLLPHVSIEAGPGGLYPFVRRDIEQRDIVAELVDGQDGVALAGKISTEGYDDIVNSATLSYALGLQRGRHQQARTITGNPAQIDTAGTVVVSLDARRSRARYGDRRLALEADFVYHQSSADQILSSLVHWRCATRRVVTLAAPFAFAWLKKGQPVLVVVASVGLRRRGWVRTIRWGESGLQIQVVLR